MKLIRYIGGRSKCYDDCAPVAFVNALKFQRRKRVTAGSHYARMRRLLQYRKHGTGTHPANLRDTAKRLGFPRIYQPKFWKLMKILFTGSGVLLDIAYRNRGEKDYAAHVFLVSGICINAGEVRFRVVGHDRAVRETELQNPWLTIMEMLYHRGYDRRGAWIRQAWRVPVNYTQRRAA